MKPGVLFDVDGTLVDTSYLHALTWSDALHQHGYDVPMAQAHRAIGLGSDRILDEMLGDDRDRGQDDELKAAHLTLYRQFWPGLRPLPGAADLLRLCAKRGLAVVLASSASAEELAVLRSALDADNAITAAIGADDVDASKPDPDIIDAALRAGKVDRERAVFVGDAVWDGQAAGRAKLPFVAVVCGGIGVDELRRAGAVATYRDPAQLVESFDSGPFGRLA